MNDNDFTRKRSLTFVNLASCIINFIRKSLQLELYNFADLIGGSSVTKQAFSKARQKLAPELFQKLNEKLIEEFYTDNHFKTFKGLRILAVDGSSIRLPQTIELYEKYGNDIQNGGVPLARTSVLFDVLNQLTLHACLYPFNASERDMAIEHILNYKTNDDFKDLFIFDRGYPSTFKMFFMKEHKKHFLMRVQEQFLKEINDVVASGLVDSVITVPAFKADRKRIPNPNFKKYLPHLEQNSSIQVRVLFYNLKNGKKEILVTSLLKKEEFSYEDIFEIYGMRWDIEENYKFYKAIAKIENFSGKLEITIKQDFYATIFACNMSMLLAQEAQDELDQEQNEKPLKYVYKINRNVLIGIVKDEIIDVFLSDRDLNEYCESLKIKIKKNLIAIKPNRTFPRVFKRVRSTISKNTV